ncbi:unnamed protein product [Gordionus sp. m RMFG-2023]|uniref:cytosolic 10-formyltetrahydrofolate dehydrogenase-like n=1 Tax=Gordionus sp. m RMFG-2023 TaxID=3053472 RepID=UPI0030E5B892
MRIAIIGQSKFSADTLKILKNNGYNICGIFCIEDKNGKPDDLAKEATNLKIPVFKIKKWRNGKLIIPEIFDLYKSIKPDLNILPFCSQFIPMEIILYPQYKSIVYHPSLLPLHRGASAINWTLMNGDKLGGFTIFWADDGLDTGSILLQKQTEIEENDTVDTLYARFLFPEGVNSLLEAVKLIENRKAPAIPQNDEMATYDPMWTKVENCAINWDQPAQRIHDFIRGNDKKPGAWAVLADESCEGKKITFYSSVLWKSFKVPVGSKMSLLNCKRPAIIHADGLIVFGNDDKMVNIKQVSLDGKLMPSNSLKDHLIEMADSGVSETSINGETGLSETELEVKSMLLLIWQNILGQTNFEENLDFFAAGADSMDVIRLTEEIKDKLSIELINEDIYMNPTFKEFVNFVTYKSRNSDSCKKGLDIEYDPIELDINDLHLKFPHQLYINGEFVNSHDGSEYYTVNPFDESIICTVSEATKEDVTNAAKAAHDAFYKGPWGQLNSRERGVLLYKLADLMESHKEELASLECIDSGAVYTVALKTHVGMSIETLRYFAGWCDKIQGSTIPINNARPNANLTFTKKIPIGVCGIITPWNYPLMMLSWKISPCLAAGNTVIVKPAQVTPLTALKFAELSHLAGFPKGVINILPGSGKICGEALLNNPLIRKIGFTGSTDIGKHIMESCARSNLKKCSLELGGKSPLIILADCDIDKAVKLAISSTMFNKGENCIAAGRIFIEEPIYDSMISKLIEAAAKIKIGDPFDRSSQHGPQNHLRHLEKLLDYIQRGILEGAKLVYGGKRVNLPGYFLQPTIFVDVDDHMFIAKEESFGPIMIISKFKTNDIDNVLNRANKTEYGLASGVITNNISRALYISDKLQSGTVFVNTYNKTDVAAPFGGIKQSGFGKDLGEDALKEWLNVKTVTIEY